MLEFRFTSRAILIFMWSTMLVMTVMDIASYIVAIIPGALDFSLLDHAVFGSWFLTKIAIIILLLFRRGPIQMAIYVLSFLLIW